MTKEEFGFIDEVYVPQTEASDNKCNVCGEVITMGLIRTCRQENCPPRNLVDGED